MSSHNLPANGLLADWNIIDPGAGGTFDVNKSPGICDIVTVSGADNSRVLPTPERSGLRIVLNLMTDAGDATITQSGSGAFNAAGNTTITLDDVGDHANLISMNVNGTLLWRDAGDGGAYS